MKEYFAETGGRYTYADDLLNLQDLALSINTLMDGCGNFIISGCITNGNTLSAGTVYINGKIRKFEGAESISYPYYIYESNHYESLTYANEENKTGRIVYGSAGSTTLPLGTDIVTQELPQYIELVSTYQPRMAECFIGKYALLLDTPFARQTVRKELQLDGKLTATDDAEFQSSVLIVHPQNSVSLREYVNQSGKYPIGYYQTGY